MRPERRLALGLGLLVLALGIRGDAGEFDSGEEAASLLLTPDLRSDQARAGEAFELLATERRRKLADLSADFVDIGIHASLQASPFKLLRAVGRVGRGVRDWDDRTWAEDEALALLAPGVRSGDLDPESLALYSHLERRESEARVSTLLADAERAFGVGDLRRTRRTIDRALALEPGSTRADRLLDALDESEWRTSLDEDAAPARTDSDRAIESWEVQLGAALLLDDLERARTLGPSDANDAALARATARFLGGDRPGALDEFRRIARGTDFAARRAGEFLADPEVDPSSEFEMQLRSYRTRRALGWVGGQELAATALPSPQEALSLSRDGLEAWEESIRAWRGALTPANLVIDAPSRAWRSWQPEGRDLSDVARRYLELVPDGEMAAEAASWLDELAVQEQKSPRVSVFEDGVLVLPHSQTAWTRLASMRLVVARAALEATASDIVSDLSDGASAVLLALDTGRGRKTESGTEVSMAASLDLLARLATGIEDETLGARGASSNDVLRSLRRLDAQVRAGRKLIARPWATELASGADALEAAFVDRERARTMGDIEIERRDEDVVAERSLGGESAACPQEMPCIEVRRTLAPIFYANGDSSGDLGIGVRASFDEARLSLEVGTSGPRASLVIPFARWLGIARYFPVEARVGIGLDGISAEPHRIGDVAGAPDPSF